MLHSDFHGTESDTLYHGRPSVVDEEDASAHSSA